MPRFLSRVHRHHCAGGRLRLSNRGGPTHATYFHSGSNHAQSVARIRENLGPKSIRWLTFSHEANASKHLPCRSSSLPKYQGWDRISDRVLVRAHGCRGSCFSHDLHKNLHNQTGRAASSPYAVYLFAAIFFRRSAHRFLMVSETRFLTSALIRPRF